MQLTKNFNFVASFDIILSKTGKTFEKFGLFCSVFVCVFTVHCSFIGYSTVSVIKSDNSVKSDRSVDSAMGADTDPDIQIIESSSSPRKPRKRPLDASENCPNSKWKDHSKNLLFKTSLQDHMKSLAASGMALNQHQGIALRLRVSFFIFPSY
jgi:hypothetical protein